MNTTRQYTDLQAYYTSFFPCESLWSLCTCAGSRPGKCRELGFWSVSETNGADILQRYATFKDAASLKRALMGRVPVKLEIGAIYPSRPVKDACPEPSERELVFGAAFFSVYAPTHDTDIDIDAYDKLRTCCSKTDVCKKCWLLVEVAMRTLDDVLRQEFGFEHLMWVFSGRRGAHCWVVDERARSLSNEERRSVVEYVNLDKVNNIEKVHDSCIGKINHPTFSRIFENIINPVFKDRYLAEQDILSVEAVKYEILRTIPYGIRTIVADNWNAKTKTTSVAKWEFLERTVAHHKAVLPFDPVKTLQLAIMCPRLDVNVSSSMNHLLKSPFSVHPSTGKLCLPIASEDFGTFDPTTVPTVKEVIAQAAVDACSIPMVEKSLRTLKEFVTSLHSR